MNTTTSDREQTASEPLLGGKWRGRSIIAFLIAAAVLLFFLSRLDINPTAILEAIKASDWRFAVLAFLVYYATFPIRAWRWRLLLRTAGMGQEEGGSLPSVPSLTRMVFLSWFANCVIPAKLGDAYRGYQVKQASGGSFATAMGTIVAERLLDILVLVVLLVIAAVDLGKTEFSDNQFAVRVVMGGVGLLGVGAIGLGAMWLLRGKLHARLPVMLQEKYRRFQEGTLGSFTVGSLAGVLPLSFAVWLGESGRLFLVAQALNLGLSFHYAIFLALANSLLTVVPFTPGGLGLVEAGVVGLLLLVGIDKDAAVATALVDRSISYWSIIILGLPLFLARRRI